MNHNITNWTFFRSASSTEQLSSYQQNNILFISLMWILLGPDEVGLSSVITLSRLVFFCKWPSTSRIEANRTILKTWTVSCYRHLYESAENLFSTIEANLAWMQCAYEVRGSGILKTDDKCDGVGGITQQFFSTSHLPFRCDAVNKDIQPNLVRSEHYYRFTW